MINRNQRVAPVAGHRELGSISPAAIRCRPQYKNKGMTYGKEVPQVLFFVFFLLVLHLLRRLVLLMLRLLQL